MSALSPTHASYLEQIGIAERPLTSSITPKQRRKRPSGGASKVIGVFTKDDLFKLRGLVFWRFHDDEIRDGRSVLLKRGLATVARLECASEALAWDAERICAGIRFKRGGA
jgi:hypothetical protein